MSTLMLLYVRSLAHNLRSNLPVLCFGMVLSSCRVDVT